LLIKKKELTVSVPMRENMGFESLITKDLRLEKNQPERGRETQGFFTALP
jgi:hypothetical protein